MVVYCWKLDVIFVCCKEYVCVLFGSCCYVFNFQFDKSFSWGFIYYYLYGCIKDVFLFDIFKLLGEEMGMMKEVRGNYLIVVGLKFFNNGDGVCYIDE